MVYDRDRKTAELEDPARELDVYMEVLGPLGITWASFYRAFAMICLLTLLAIELQVSPLAAIDERLALSAILTVLAVTTSYQVWRRRWIVLRLLAQ